MPTSKDPSSEAVERIWNSLEVAKLLVAFLIPVSIGAFTAVNLNQQQKAAEKERDAARTAEMRVREAAIHRERVAQVATHRVSLWRDLAPPMNDLYCYFAYVGGWKEIDPDEVLKTKRRTDRIIYSNRPFFSQNFVEAYEAVMKTAFSTYNAWPQDALLRTRPIRALDKGKEGRFHTEPQGAYIDSRQDVHDAYYLWLDIARLELNLDLPAVAPANLSELGPTAPLSPSSSDPRGKAVN